MNLQSAKLMLAGQKLSASDAFNLIDFAHKFWQDSLTDVDALDLIVRLVSRRHDIESVLEGSSEMLDEVARFAGLYPYMKPKEFGAGALVKNAMRVSKLPTITFHKGQIAALSRLLKGESLILSAPTSFGKSLLVDVIIYSLQPSLVVIVVPTLALLDEYRRRLKSTFRDYQIVTRVSDVARNQKVIYLGTQERIEEREPPPKVDLFVIDEFYKLDLSRNDERAAALNSVMSIFTPRAKQSYFLGPSIAGVTGVSPDQNLGIPFLKSSFSPVAADIVRIKTGSGEAEKQNRLSDILDKTDDEPTLVYLRSPRATYKIGLDVVASRDVSNEWGGKVADSVRENYHEKWVLAECLQRGTGIHHGRIPRALAQYQISLFNEGKINRILCTSSMIEGVNTKAKNVIIFDNYISTNKLDRFTFDNIKGRAGRMFQHFVGKVFLFGDAPLGEEISVEIPLFNGFDNASDEVITSVPAEALGPRARARRDSIVRRSPLSAELLKRWGRYGVDGLNDLSEELFDRRNDHLLIWRGQGNFHEMEATFDLAWRHLNFSKHGMRSGRQAAFYSVRLRASETIKSFLEKMSRSEGLKLQIEIDDALNFLRAAEFTLPQILMAIQDVAGEVQIKGLDYSVLVGRLPQWFQQKNYQDFEESGLPSPTAQRMGIFSDDNNGLQRYLGISGQTTDDVDSDLLRRWSLEEFGT